MRSGPLNSAGPTCPRPTFNLPPETKERIDMAGIASSYDMLVAGAGLAGMTAAASVARDGGRVLVMEKSPQVGGSSLMSGGVVWTAQDAELLIRQCPKANPDLIRILLEDYPRLIEWFRSFEVEVSEPFEVLGYGRGSRVDLAAYVDKAAKVIEGAGGTL